MCAVSPMLLVFKNILYAIWNAPDRPNETSGVYVLKSRRHLFLLLVSLYIIDQLKRKCLHVPVHQFEFYLFLENICLFGKDDCLSTF